MVQRSGGPRTPVNEQALRFCRRPPTMLIGEQWRAARDGRTTPVINPADGSVLATAPAAGAGDVDDAVDCARRAFDLGPWRKAAYAERSRILWRIADLIELHAEELAQLETLNNGKTLRASSAGDIPRAAEMFRYMAGWCTKIHGSTFPVGVPETVLAYSRREPVGVAGLIVPWNFPLSMASNKIAPALAAGCTVVLKPAEETPLTALRLGELALEAGLPPGVLNIVTGDGPGAGAAMAAHPGIDKISFTGSTEVGRRIMVAATGNLKRLTLELGGKSPTIILPDADLEAAIASASAAIFGNAGQVCVAGSRLFAHEAVYDEILDGVTRFATGLRVGDGMATDTDLGPLISARQRDRVMGYVKVGLDEGARVQTGGNIVAGPGFFVEPTVLGEVGDAMRVAQEEIFGPVLSMMRFETIDDLVARANSTQYGLSACVWTRDIAKAHMIAADLKAGTVWVNNYGISDPAVPFGGYKHSGWGRERGLAGVESFTEQKSVVVRIGQP